MGNKGGPTVWGAEFLGVIEEFWRFWDTAPPELPPRLFLDEPSAAVDAGAKRHLWKAISDRSHWRRASSTLSPVLVPLNPKP